MVNLLDDDALLDLRATPRARREHGTPPLAGADAAQPVADARAAQDEPPAHAGVLPEAAGPAPEHDGADVCHVCARPATRTCKSCEQRVCAADSWVMFGLCRVCASEDRVKRWNSRQQATGGNWLEES